MRLFKNIFYRALLCLTAFLFLARPAFAVTGDHPVLIISSYNPDAGQTSGNISDFMEEFQRLDGKCGVELENINCKSFSEAPWWKQRMVGIPVILVIEVEGAGNIKKMYPGATTIFVLPPDMQELERRLRCRGTEDEETIQRRLKRAEAEIANSVNYDEHVVNIEVDSCAESIYSIIQFKLQHGSDE